jgi:hypothetical protein
MSFGNTITMSVLVAEPLLFLLGDFNVSPGSCNAFFMHQGLESN